VSAANTTSAKQSSAPRLLLTRAETLASLRIGKTTLYWLQRIRRLNPINIGARVLFNPAEVEHIARHGCSLTEADKRAATRPRPVSDERGDPGKREDRPSPLSDEADKHTRKLDTGNI
jgi:hypothetical protein